MHRINLLPPELLPGPYIQGRRLFVIAGLTLITGMFIIGGGIFYLQLTGIKIELQAARAELAVLTPEAKNVTSLRVQRQETEKKTAVFENILLQQGKYKPLLNKLAESIPVDMWLTGISVQAGKAGEPAGTASSPSQKTPPATPESSPSLQSAPVMVIKGVSRSVSSMGVYVQKLLELTYFSDVRLEEFKEQEDGPLAFTITCSLQIGGATVAAKAGQ